VTYAFLLEVALNRYPRSACRLAGQLRDENRKLKQVVADLSLDKTILQESLRKNW
jgi:hypothetical protein